MPIFRMNMSDAKKRRFRQIVNTAKTNQGRKRRWAKAWFGWVYENTSFAEIDRNFGNEVSSAIKRLQKNSNILDLGCGRLTALSELATKNPELNFFGISRDVYPEFEYINQKNISVLAEDAHVSLDFLQKKKKKFGIIFSNHGPAAVFNKFGEAQIRTFKQIHSLLVVGGEAFLHPVQGWDAMKGNLEGIGFEIRFFPISRKLILKKVR